MYDGFYNLTRKPFQLTADPEFFFNSAVHRRALAYMRYGLTQGEGLVVVTGKPGMGKTMLVKEIVASLNDDNVTVGVMVTSHVSAEDTLRLIAATFGLPFDSEDKATIQTRLKRFIIDQARNKKRVLLVVDEAQNLPRQSLEELRMLSNFEMDGKPHFQVFLVGQKELAQTLSAPGMEQFKQRTVASFQLKSLNEEETKNYILYRLEKSGWVNNPVFEEEVFQQIYAFTEGIPRRVNSLCERILLYGYLEELHTITIKDVEKVIEEIEEDDESSREGLGGEFKRPAMEVNQGGPIEERISSLEKVVYNLQETISKERALLRKAILIQLDMGDVYDKE